MRSYRPKNKKPLTEPVKIHRQHARQARLSCTFFLKSSRVGFLSIGGTTPQASEYLRSIKCRKLWECHMCNMADPTEPKDQRVPVMMTASEIKALDDWSFARRIRSRSEAIRQLVALGLRRRMLEMVAANKRCRCPRFGLVRECALEAAGGGWYSKSPSLAYLAPDGPFAGPLNAGSPPAHSLRLFGQ